MVRKIYFYTLIFLAFLFTSKVLANPVDDVIRSNPQFKNAVVAVSVKEQNTGNIFYQKNQNILVHPASSLKIITSSAALEYLGTDYKFQTALYKKGGRIYLKVGADPLFSYADIIALINQYKNKNSSNIIKHFSIDDTITDKMSYGIGWQLDDNANKNFPQISPYIIDGNLFAVKAVLENKSSIRIDKAQEYQEKIINKLKYGEDNIIVERNLFADNQPVIIRGTISKTQKIALPAKNPQQLYFNVFIYNLMDKGITVSRNIQLEKIPLFSTLQAEITHDIKDVLKLINTNSNNLAAEILIKHAAAIANEKTGTTQEGLELVRNFYAKNNLDTTNLIMVDASGVSMNDYVNADFMTDALRIISKNANFDVIKNSMTDTDNGTFKGRLPELNGRLKVKTGTLANTSAVVGYINTISGKNLVFAIMLDNLPDNVNPKEFEDKIIKAVYQF